MSGFDLRVEVDGADELAAAFEAAPEDMSTSLHPVVDERAEKLQRDWRSNARKTARRHGRRYPSSITHDLYQGEGAIWADIGPDVAKPQGGMGRGFEYGGVHQPPHMDGAIAFASNAAKFEHAISDAIDDVIDRALG